MEQLAKLAGYALLSIITLACLALILHYAGVISATSPAWLWGFVWGPPAIAASIGLLFGVWTFLFG